MAAVKVAISYLKHRESLLREQLGDLNVSLFEQLDYRLNVLPPESYPKLEAHEHPQCVNNLNVPRPLHLSEVMSLMKDDVYAGCEHIFAHLVNVLLRTRMGYRVRCNLRLYRLILMYFGPLYYRSFRVRTDAGLNMRFKRKRGLVLRSCTPRRSRRYLLSCIHRLLNSGLLVTRSLWGFRVCLSDLLRLVFYVARYRNDAGPWETVEILSANQDLAFLTASHLLVNALFRANFHSDLLVSAASRWKSFDLSYFRQNIAIILFMNALNVNSCAGEILADFKRMLNHSFNRAWNEFASVNTNDLNPYLLYIRQFYVALNMESPFHWVKPTHKFAHPVNYVPRNLVLDDRYNMPFLKYVLFVVRQLVTNPSPFNLLAIVELVTQYFTYRTLKFGFLKCASPYRCLKCTATFTLVYCELTEVLDGLRSLTVDCQHLFLVRMLIKNEIERIKTCFFGSYTSDLSTFFSNYRFDPDVTPDLLERSLSKHHYAPKFSKYLKYRLCCSLLKRILDRNINIFIKETSVSTSSRCSWYLKLLLCVDVHVKKVDPRVSINKSLSSGTYLHMDQLSHRPPASDSYTAVYWGNEVLSEEFEILFNLYVGKASIHQYLSVFALSDQLNVIQRTQACLALSRNLKYVELVLEQLVQCLFIDPGDRVINLLYLALSSTSIRGKILYHLSCLIHSNVSAATNHKIYTFIKFIFNLLPDEARKVYGNQIVLHGQLLDLTLQLGDLPLSKRYEVLNKKILEVGETVSTAPNLFLYKDLDDYFAKDERAFKHPRSRSLSTQASETLKSGDMGERPCDDVTNHSDNRVPHHEMDVLNPGMEHVNGPMVGFDEEKDGDRIVGIDVDSVKILNSATRAPFMIKYRLLDGRDRTYIYKMKDDLRQDCLAIQMKRILLRVCRSHELDVFLQPFLVVPYSSILGEIFSKSTINDISLAPHFPRKEFEIGGVVGFIPDTISRHTIGKEFGVSIKNFFLNRFGHEASPNYVRAVHNFITSLAGYALLSFLMQVKDRHNGNLLFTTTGHIIHIDFGFILGASPAKDLHFELAPFKLTEEMVDFMGGYDSDNFSKFIHLVINSYMAMRTHSNLVVTLVELLQCSNIPCFRKSTLSKLKRRLRLTDSPTDAKNYILRKIFYALHSRTTRLYDVVQNYQQGIQH